MTPAIWLVTGAQGAGKSAVADLLARAFERGVHVRGGQFYRWAPRGWVHFDDPLQPEEARRLLALRYRLSAVVALEYVAAGFTCVVQDNIYGPDVTTWLGLTDAWPRHLVVLRPSVTALTAREAARRLTTGKIAYRGGYTPAANDAAVGTTSAIGLWLDTSQHSPAETVAEILNRSDEALVV